MSGVAGRACSIGPAAEGVVASLGGRAGGGGMRIGDAIGVGIGVGRGEDGLSVDVRIGSDAGA